MATNKKWQKGDIIVDYSQVYKITKITQGKTVEGEKDDMVHYSPYFKNSRNETITRTIPLSSIDDTNKRKAISKKKMDDLLALLEKPSTVNRRLNLRSARENVYNNDPEKLVDILRRLQREKEDEDINFTISRKELYETATNRLAEEVAVVKDISLAEAKELILGNLQSRE